MSSKPASKEKESFEEFLLDDHLDILTEENENDEETRLGEKVEHIPIRLQQIMQDYQTQLSFKHCSDLSLNEIDEFEEISRSFDDVMTLEGIP
jgi:hypothetical protein